MPLQPFQDVRPRGRLSAEDLERAFAAAEAFSRFLGSGNNLVRNTGAGISVIDTTPASPYLKITGAAGGPHGNAYPWQEQRQDTPGTWVDNTDGRSGTTTANPAYEVNGSTTVPSGTIAKAYLHPSGEYYLFAFESSSGSSLTVEQHDQSVVDADVTLLTFDQATGLALAANPQIAITNASNTSPIVVTTSGPHGFFTGQNIVVLHVGGNTTANGLWNGIQVLGATRFTLPGSTGNGPYTTGGTATLQGSGRADVSNLPASLTQAGIVTVNDQVMGGGIKYFHRGIAINYDSGFTSIYGLYIHEGPLPGSSPSFSVGGAYIEGGLDVVNQATFYAGITNSSLIQILAASPTGFPALLGESANASGMYLEWHHTGGPAPALFHHSLNLLPTSIGDTVAYACNGSVGVTGTFVDKNNNTVHVTGGIITALS